MSLDLSLLSLPRFPQHPSYINYPENKEFLCGSWVVGQVRQGQPVPRVCYLVHSWREAVKAMIDFRNASWEKVDIERNYTRHDLGQPQGTAVTDYWMVAWAEVPVENEFGLECP